MSALVFGVADLLRKPGSERAVHLVTSTEELGINDPRLVQGEVLIDLRLDVLGDGILANGTVKADWVGECRRCLAPIGGSLVVPVHEVYQARVTDPDAFPLEHDHLDLRPMVSEALLLDAPVAPLCRADCAGFCPTCGNDRNLQPCDCTNLAIDDRWAALDALRDDSR